MPKHQKHGKGRLTIHLEELVRRANSVKASQPPELQLDSLMQSILIDYNAYAGIDGAKQYNVHWRLVEPLDG